MDNLAERKSSSKKTRIYKRGTKKRGKRNELERRTMAEDPTQRKLFEIKPFSQSTVLSPSISFAAVTEVPIASVSCAFIFQWVYMANCEFNHFLHHEMDTHRIW